MSDTKIARVNNLFNSFKTTDHTDDDIKHIISELDIVGLRDAVFRKFAELDKNDARSYLSGLSDFASIVSNVTLRERNTFDTFGIGVMYTYAGLSTAKEWEEQDYVDGLMNNIDGLLGCVLESGEFNSLARLFEVARKHNVPNHVFYDSVVNVSFEDILETIPDETEEGEDADVEA